MQKHSLGVNSVQLHHFKSKALKEAKANILLVPISNHIIKEIKYFKTTDDNGMFLYECCITIEYTDKDIIQYKFKNKQNVV